MESKYLFLLFDALFGIVPIGFMLTRHRKTAWKYRKLIFWSILISIPASIITDFFGVRGHAWQYSYNKSLQIFIFGSLFELILWGIFFALAIGLIVAVFAEKEEKNKSFWPFF